MSAKRSIVRRGVIMRMLPPRLWLWMAAACLVGCIAAGAMTLDEYLDTVPVENVDTSSAPDGNYSGAYQIAVPAGTYAMYRDVKVDVAIKDGRYSSITIVKPPSFTDDKDFKAMCQQIVDHDTLVGIDVVSGASVSSRALLKAVEDAASHAAGSTP
jgi:uncharacterized protein with FMN-binding domain